MVPNALLKPVLGLAVGVLTFILVPADREVALALGVFVTIAWFWISEAIHISATALMVPVLAVATGLLDMRGAVSGFASPVIFLFMGGFALAAALQRHGIDRWVASRILSLSPGRPLVAIVLLFLATSLLSMWISNTATVALMLPIALGLLGRESADEKPALYCFLLLGLAYAGNIGGMATLIGSPPNAIAASAAGISFTEWLGFGLPAFAVFFPAMVVLLYVIVRPQLNLAMDMADDTAEALPGRGLVVLIFVATATCWVLGDFIAPLLGVESGFDTLVALAAIVALTATRSLPFDDFVAKTNWGILLLFGGGLTLSALMGTSGASQYLADVVVAVMPGDSRWLLYLGICLFVIFLTELVSNTASAALLVPIFMTVAAGLGAGEVEVAVMIAIGASCAFMLPVATPPNALVFGSGFVPQRTMMRTGLVLNLAFAVVLSLMFTVFGP